MSCEGEQSVPRQYVQQRQTRPRTVLIDGELKYQITLNKNSFFLSLPSLPDKEVVHNVVVREYQEGNNKS